MFDAQAGGWVSCGLDSEGKRHGAFTVQREDGSVLLAGAYQHGEPVGAFVGYHPGGDVASEAHYQNGVLDGRVVRFASDAPGATPLRSCCVPEGARQMHLFYDAGRVRGERFVDAEGRALGSDGTPLPPLPPGLPEWASFEDRAQRWSVREPERDGGWIVSSYDLAGNRVEEVEFAERRRVGSRRFDTDGALLEERRLDAQGKLDGEYFCRHPGASPYVDARIRAERGQFETGHPVGSWHFLDADGNPVRSVERGPRVPAARLEELAREPLPEMETGTALARECVARGRVREGLLLAARLLARTPTDDTFLELLDAVVPAAGESQRAAWRRAFAQSTGLDAEVVLDGLLAGANPAEALRCLAPLLPMDSLAGLELIDAALALEPDNVEGRARRAMLGLDHGRVEAALADATELAAHGQTEAAELVERTVRILYVNPGFTPERDPLPTAPEELPELVVAQPLTEVRRAIGTYATRLSRARAMIAERLGHPPAWLPDVGFLLPEGHVELRRLRATIEDETESGIETSEVEVDEGLGLEATSVRGLAVTARADWDALCWLCWAVGLDRLAQPDAIRPPAELAAVVNDTMVRAFRCQDQVRTGGIAARVKKLPSFDWEGTPVAALPRSFATVAARQYLERRAMLFWLMFEQNVSPFQADLRKI